MAYKDLARTFAIFPLRPTIDGVCTCEKGPECKAASKHPAKFWKGLKKGEQLDIPKGCGYGIATGERSGVVVVEEDEPGLIEKLGDIPPTLTVRSARGRHYYFQWPGFPVPSPIGMLAPHVDIRGDGGMVVGPGSTHKSGVQYTLEKDLPPAPMPEWLLSWLKDFAKKPVAEVPGNIGIWGAPAEAASEAFIAAAQDAYARVPEGTGQRNVIRMAFAGALLRDYDSGWVLKALREVFGSEADAVVAQCASRLETGDSCFGWGQLEQSGVSVDTVRKPLDMWRRDSMSELFRPKVSPGAEPGKRGYIYQVGKMAGAGKDKILPNDAQMYLYNHPEWLGVWRFDEFAGRVSAHDPPVKLYAERSGLQNTDILAVQSWFNLKGFLVSKDSCLDYIQNVAHASPYHPVKAFLEEVRPRARMGAIQDIATRVLGCKEAIEIEILRRFMIGAVARIFLPGSKFDTMLVLQGKQGKRKSTFVLELFGKQWTAEELPGFDKEGSRHIQGKWAVEVAELSTLLRSREAQSAKAFLSRVVDRFDEKFERSQDRPRQCVFIGTTNDDDFLRDATGERRYLIIRIIENIDIDRLKGLRAEAWGEAYEAFLRSESSYLSPENEALADAYRDDFKKRDPLEGSLTKWLEGREFVTMQEVIEWATIKQKSLVDAGAGRLDHRLGECLQNQGCEKEKGTKGRRWVVPEHLATIVAVLKVVK
jgi:hypothetical protein